MKRFFSLILVCFFALCGCAKPDDSAVLQPPAKEGVAPYALSDRETELLRSFGIEPGQAKMLSFCAPEEAITMHVDIQQLGTDGVWETVDGGDISIGAEREPIDRLAGFLTMRLLPDHAVEFHVSCGGRHSFRSEAIVPETPFLSSGTGFLSDQTTIELEQPIPVALAAYAGPGRGIRSFSLQDYFEPSRFENTDFVQAVTLTFSAEA